MNRYRCLDGIRGVTLCSMILYHAVWDLVYLFGRDWKWYGTEFAYVWQQSICWCFILLSGFCYSFGRKKWKRGLIVFGAGTVITVVTHVFMPVQKIRFGVLTFLGSAMLVLWLFEKMGSLFGEKIVLQKVPAGLRMFVAFLLFYLTKGINYRYLGFDRMRLVKLPAFLYEQGDFMTFLGFTRGDFYSTDYFSMMPWFFLFLTGYFLYELVMKKGWLPKLATFPSLGRFFDFVGKHSLIIYMFHQPVIYGVLYLIA